MADNKKDSSSTDKKNWYGDRYQFIVIQRNILALITLFSLLCSIAATFSISQLAPLKSVEPFVIQIDQKSGITQVVDPLGAKALTANEAINNYFMVLYIRARESYLGSQSAGYANYNLVRVFSDRNIFQQYQNDITLSNPKSPGARLGTGGMREIGIESITFQDKKILPDGQETRKYFVTIKITEKIGAMTKESHKHVTIEFKYAELDLSNADRYLNPIGFRVLDYRVDDIDFEPQ